jgi:sulfofructose kinase
MLPPPDSPTIDVLALGAAAIDELLYVERYPDPDTKTSVHAFTRQCGGLSATALVAAARLGARCAYAGTLGPPADADSQFVLDALHAEGIDTTHCARRAGGGPIKSVIIVGSASGTRNIFPRQPTHTGAHPELPAAAVIADARVLLVDHLGVPGMLRAAQIARAAGVPIVSDVERAEPQTAELLALVDHAVLGADFAAQLTGSADVAAALRRLWLPSRSSVTITCGARGAYFSTDGQVVQHQPAFPVNVVDTTGCGDVFHGAFCAWLAADQPVADCVRAGAGAAALKAMQPGAQQGAPTRRQLLALLASPT